MTSQTKLLALKKFFLIFELVISCKKNFNIILELVTGNFERK